MISDMTFGLLGRIFLATPAAAVDAVTAIGWPADEEDTETRLWVPLEVAWLLLAMLAIILFLAGVERIMLFIRMISLDPVTWCGLTFCKIQFNLRVIFAGQ